MACDDQTWKTFTKEGDLHVFGVRKSPADAPDPQSDYERVLQDQVDNYVTQNNEAPKQCAKGCDVVAIEDDAPGRVFDRRPRWIWPETYFEPGEPGEPGEPIPPPVRRTARYTVSGQQAVRRLIKTKVCVPEMPVLESAYLPDGTRVDWDITSLVARLADVVEENELEDALLALGPLENTPIPDKDKKKT